MAALLFCESAQADDWTAQDFALEGSFIALYALDWSETSWALGHATGFAENNPILGRQPSRGKLAAYSVGVLLLHPAISALLPRPWRTVWQTLGIGVEISAVGRNASLGVRLAWP